MKSFDHYRVSIARAVLVPAVVLAAGGWMHSPLHAQQGAWTTEIREDWEFRQPAWPVVTGSIAPRSPSGPETAAPTIQEKARVQEWNVVRPRNSPPARRIAAQEPAVRRSSETGAKTAIVPEPGNAESPAPATVPATVVPVAQPPASVEGKSKPAPTTTAEEYCASVSGVAEQTQIKMERDALSALAGDIEKRLILLESKIAEHKDWLAKREDFLARARDSMVQIYARMKSEAAAAQVSEMDPVSAAATLARMDPKVAGAILAEIDPAKGARLSNIIAGLADMTRSGDPKDKGGGR